MSDIEIGISKKKLSTQEVAINRFDVYDVIEEVDNESLETEVIESELSTEPDGITIEITGLKSVDSFIGLTDTPLYYENGKFFKVEDNKVVYCDITWADITGSIQDNPDLQNQVEEIAKQYSETFILNTVDKAIEIHNENANAHAFLRDLISDNYITLDNKIDILNNILTNSIEALDLRVVDNTDNITTLIQKQATTETDINNINSNISDINGDIDSINLNISELYTSIDTNKTDISNLNTTVEENYNALNNLITDNTNNISQNIQDISDLKTNLDTNYTSTSNLATVALTGEYNDLLNKPEIPSIEGLATTEYVDQKTNEVLGTIIEFDFITVDELPEVGESNHIYLVAHEHGEKDIYDEYIWIEATQSFEKIGNTDIDLSNYYTKEESNTLFDTKVDKIEGYSLVADTEIERLSTVNNYDDTEVRNLINTKQDLLTAGENVNIVYDEETGLTTISSIDTNTVYTAGEGISIDENNVITNTREELNWGNITGDITLQEDLQEVLNTKVNTETFTEELDKKQNTLIAGEGVEITDDGTISGTVITFRDWSV